ncbi:hypothetical protein GIY30_02115 [Gordonia sp. HNM0687]|uniref:Uncharacterized protein n=1 Tax=Gordonia mangrovi TaxID=2665643 RepID=A0A6L7GJU9_9ACTN|nr:hypothetical protein [Gordonia mangrovi]MXP20166.1 hypothetical protein [Gordonia mangrovi]UVF79227.1 hypothetical protein NWF22_05125 [Gordonia mangrovi]
MTDPQPASGNLEAVHDDPSRSSSRNKWMREVVLALAAALIGGGIASATSFFVVQADDERAVEDFRRNELTERYQALAGDAIRIRQEAWDLSWCVVLDDRTGCHDRVRAVSEKGDRFDEDHEDLQVFGSAELSNAVEAFSVRLWQLGTKYEENADSYVSSREEVDAAFADLMYAVRADLGL